MLGVVKGLLRHPVHFCRVLSLKRKLSSCGRGLMIFGRPRIISPERVSIGNNVALNDGCLINASYSSITIGNNVIISSDAKIIAASLDTERFLLKNDRSHVDRGVVIGDNVWICAGAIICPGVHVMGEAVIAAGAVVVDNIEEQNVLIAGCPARVVKRLKEGLDVHI